MALPEVRAVGTVASGIEAVAPGLPTGTAAGDLLLMVVESQGAGSQPSATGWLVGPTGSKVQGNTRLTILWKIAVGSDATTTNDTGDHQMARIIGIKTGTFDASGWPFNAWAVGVQAATTSVSIPGGTTTVAECLVLAAASGSLPDASSTAEFSAVANASLGTVTERMDNAATAGDGGALFLASGTKATKGAYSATTATAATSAERAVMSLAISPTGTKYTRKFNGSSDKLIGAQGALSSITGAVTMAALVRVEGDGTERSVFNLHNASGEGTGYDMWLNLTNKLSFYNGSGEVQESTIEVLEAQGWQLLVIAKAAGESKPIYYSYNFGTGTLTKVEGAAVYKDTPSVSGGSLRIGEWQGEEFFKGSIAAVAMWNTALSQAQIEALITTPLKSWGTFNSPKAVIRLDQELVTTAFTDDTGGGATQSERSGTTTALTAIPWTYESTAPNIPLSTAPITTGTTAKLTAATGVALGACPVQTNSTLVLTAATRIPLGAAPITTGTTVALTAATSVPLSTAPITTSTTAQIKAGRQVPLSPAPIQTNSTMTLGTGVVIPIAGSWTFGSTAQLTAATGVPLGTAPISTTTTITLSAPTRVPLSPAPATFGTSISIKFPLRINPIPIITNSTLAAIKTVPRFQLTTPIVFGSTLAITRPTKPGYYVRMAGVWRKVA